LKRENQLLLVQYELMNDQLEDVDQVLGDVRRRDDNIYRVIFEADPLPESVREAGVGGVNRYKDLEGYASSDMLIATRKRLDKLGKQLYVQSLSLDEVADLALRKQEMLASIPAVQPVSNADLEHIASALACGCTRSTRSSSSTRAWTSPHPSARRSTPPAMAR
jgi:hypothetical protein